MNNTKLCAVCCLTLALAFSRAHGQTGQSEPGKDFVSYKSYMMDHYRGLENGDPNTSNPVMFRKSGGFKGVPGKVNYSHIYDYKKGDSRNYMKDQIIQKVGVFAQALADTAGSAFAFDSSGQLRSQASQLNATGDPNFKQVASLLNQEATAVDQGDRAQAQNLAGQIAPMATLPVSTSYSPTPEQNQFVEAFGSVLKVAITALSIYYGGVWGAMFVSALGINGSSTQSVVGNGLNGLLSSQPPSSVASNTGVGLVNVAGGQLSGVVNQKMNPGSSLQPVPQGSNNGQAVPKP